jgi:organic hydroperoxide reductase OsmC/OhrA
MSRHRAAVEWTLKPGEDFAAGRYSRGHVVRFEAHEVPATASRHVVGKWAAPGGVDPEEMFVAALANCHMLTFLHRARLAGFVAVAYRDAAEGVMEKIEGGRMAVTRVTLKPEIDWEGAAPDAATLDRLHHEAHEECFIANSVKTEVVVV